MKNEPLFLRIANGRASVLDPARAFASSAHEPTANSAAVIVSDPSLYPYSFSDFVQKFRAILADIVDNGLTAQVMSACTSYVETSLLEVSKGSSFSNKGSTSEYPIIRDPAQPWAEGLVCYNLGKYIKAYGVQEIKVCKKCRTFFAGRGKYAAYCSDACKEGRK